jgi:hypothetical protein
MEVQPTQTGAKMGRTMVKRVRTLETSATVAGWVELPKSYVFVSTCRYCFQENTRTALKGSGPGATGFSSEGNQGGSEDDSEAGQHHYVCKVRSKAFKTEVFLAVRHWGVRAGAW